MTRCTKSRRIPTIRIPPGARSRARSACAPSATTRKLQALLEQLVVIAKDDAQNIMPVTIELVENGATMGDIVEKLKTIWGTYRENPVF